MDDHLSSTVLALIPTSLAPSKLLEDRSVRQSPASRGSPVPARCRKGSTTPCSYSTSPR